MTATLPRDTPLALSNIASGQAIGFAARAVGALVGGIPGIGPLLGLIGFDDILEAAIENAVTRGTQLDVDDALAYAEG